MEPTLDPGCGIEARGSDGGVPWVRYVIPATGERWIIRGTCIACGACEVGSRNPHLVWTGVPVGQPGACLDRTFGTRRDVPVRPEIMDTTAACVLTGEYV